MKIHVVLVRTEHSQNIGAVARAMANMAADRLILIDPKCKVDSMARILAAGAQDQLSHVVTYPSWNEFYNHEGDGLRIALSRRAGKKRKVTDFKKTLGRNLEVLPNHLYLIFGPESDGLNADDLAFANFTSYLPVHGEFQSMNLAQAVLLTLFIARDLVPLNSAIEPTTKTGRADPPVQPFYFPDQLIKDWIEAMGFDVSARKASAYLTLRRLFLQNRPTAHEFRVLEAILQQNIRKLKGQDLVGLATEELRDDFRDVPRQ